MATAFRVLGVACFFAGLFFLSQLYTMAFHGVYVDCFGGSGCTLRTYGEQPTLTASLYGSVLAIGVLVTFYLGLSAFRSGRRSAS